MQTCLFICNQCILNGIKLQSKGNGCCFSKLVKLQACLSNSRKNRRVVDYPDLDSMPFGLQDNINMSCCCQRVAQDKERDILCLALLQKVRKLILKVPSLQDMYFIPNHLFQLLQRS